MALGTAPVTVAPEPAMTSPGRRAGCWSLRAAKAYGPEETGCQAAYCKHTAQGSTNRLTRAVTIVSAAAHHSYKHIPCIHKGAVQ